MADRKVFGNSGPVSPDLKRATFDKSFVNNLTAKTGYAIPVLVEEAPPNSSYSIDTNFAFDIQPMFYPVQNNITAHFSIYSVPFRILWKHYKRFNDLIGTDGQINGQNSYVMPYIKRAHGEDTWNLQGSLFDYMGLPTTYFSSKDDLITLDKTLCKPMNCRRVMRNGLPVNNILDLYHIGGTIPLPHVDGLYNLTNKTSFGFTINFRNITLSDGAYVRIPFFAVYSDTLAQDITSQITSQNGKFVLHFGRLVNQSSDPFGDATDSNIAVDLSVDLTWSVEFVRTYNIQGTSVGLFYYQFNIDPARVSQVQQIISMDNHSVAFLEFDSDDDGLTSFTPLVNYPSNLNLSQEVHPTSLLDYDEKDGVYTDLFPNVTYYGWSREVHVLSKVFLNGSRDRFCSVNGADPVFPVNALAFRAYECIGNFFFRNTRVDPFIKDNQPCYDEFITNDGDGADTTTPVHMFRVPWEYDLFTTAVPQPFFGNAPLVGVTTNKDSNGNVSSAVFHMKDENDNDYTFTVDTESNGRITGISLQGDVDGNSANTPAMNALNYAIQYGISISDFRNADALTRFVEKRMRAGNLHPDIVQEFYGVRPSLGEEYPRYCGGCTRRVNVNKIMNTAQSSGNPLGDFAGTANVNGSSERIKIFCAERSYIIGLLWFSVTPVYAQQCPAHYFKSTVYDYLQPLFANISPQPIPTKWIAPLQLGDDELDDVFGYGRPYADYVSRRDEVHGDFRGNMSDFLMQRLFFNKPRLNKSFLEINSKDLTDVFTNTDDNDKILGQVAFSIRAKLPLPQYSTPQII